MKKKRYTQAGFTPEHSPRIMHSMQELRRSSAASPHTPRPRKGSRTERERQAIRDQLRDQN